MKEIDDLLEATEKLKSEIILESGNRRSLLLSHGIFGVLSGALFTLGAGNSVSWNALGGFFAKSSTQDLFGFLLVMGGGILILSLPQRNFLAEIIGLISMSFWYSIMAATSLARYLADVSTMPGHPVTVYASISVMMLIHVVTLLKKQNIINRRRVTT